MVPLVVSGAGHHRAEGGGIESGNVILIVVDTLAAQHLGFMGYERDTSPFMDELASRSVVFDCAYTPKSTTGPAVTSLLSARHPARHGVIDNGVNLPPDIRFLTEDFRDAGFATWGVAAARVLGAQYGFDRGFDYYANIPAIPHDAPAIIERLKRILGGSPWLGEPSRAETRGPLFLMVHFYDPHTDYAPDEDILAGFADPEYSGVVDGTGEQLLRYNDYEIDLDEGDLRRVRDLYDAEIRTFDDHLRTLFDLLGEYGLIDRSIIVLTADHGENLGEHHFTTHGHPYEASLHIPLLFHFPGDRFGGTRIDAVVENTDILPTLLELADVEIPNGLDGGSLMGLIDPEAGETYPQREYLYAIGYPTEAGRTYGAFDGRYRLIVDVVEGGNSDRVRDVLLYDILGDPHETRNLAGEKPDVLGRLVSVLGPMIAPSPDIRMAAMDPSTQEMLRSLGYTER